MYEQILILGAGKSATSLISYLINQAFKYSWKTIIVDSNLALVQSKTANSPFTEACSIDIRDSEERLNLIHQSNLVIALLPPPLLPLLAADCIRAKKHLLTASYLDQVFKALEPDINKANILVLGELGLDPGIDHMSAVKWIDTIRVQGGRITSFRSHCGGLVSPQSDNNSWHYKISWNPRNIILAGSMGAVYKEGGQQKETAYHDLFHGCEEIDIPGLGKLVCYPNRDSLHYQALYNLQDADTFQRTTLRHPEFCKAWDAVVKAGLTMTDKPVPHPISFCEWSNPIEPFITLENRTQLAYLGLFDSSLIPNHLTYSADALQYLFEKKLSLQPVDKDMIVMLHQITYELNNKKYLLESLLIVEGEKALETAMAKTVGLPLGIAAKLILQDKIKMRGLHIPIHKEIYEPVLAELAKHGIQFRDRITEIL